MININQRCGVSLNSKGLHLYLDINLGHVQEIPNHENVALRIYFSVI